MKKENLVSTLHHANVLKTQGFFKEATELLQKIIAEYPDYAPALNNLGNVFYAQGKLQDAVMAYHAAVQKAPEFVDAYYNLALALTKQNQLDEAITIYRKLLQLAPEHYAARFLLASNLMRIEKIDDALNEFLHIEKSEPNHLETQSNMALCYLKKGALNEAKMHYKKALELTPNDTEILFNLGVIDTQLGNLDLAIQHYQKAVRIDANFFAAHNNLGVAFLAKQHIPFALQHFKEALKLEPNNTSIQYTIQALSQNQSLLSAPTDYVKSLFDSYADHYEQHLLTALDYQVPAHFKRLLTKLHRANVKWDILDLGAGTGLCGTVVKPFAKTLTGVDLSEKMLAMAQTKHIYDHLVCEVLDSFLSSKTAVYDLILAGDVLVYIGDLSMLFKHVAKALRANGLFLFNTEISENDDFKMNQSGRFLHHKKYIETLAKKNHFAVIQYEKAITRMQNNQPVYGHLFVLQRGVL